jgi:predicted nucleotidyltransferase
MNDTDLTFTADEKSVINSMGVSAVILFGSHAQGKPGPMSDYDIGVLCENPGILQDYKVRRVIYDILYSMFSVKINKLVDIDIVFLTKAPMELQSHAARYGKILYENQRGAFAYFRERVMEKYADFAPIRAIFHEAVLDRI